jgi:hypothetical protein
MEQLAQLVYKDPPEVMEQLVLLDHKDHKGHRVP